MLVLILEKTEIQKKIYISKLLVKGLNYSKVIQIDSKIFFVGLILIKIVTLNIF